MTAKSPDGSVKVGRVSIMRTKPDYYRLLQTVRDEDTWEEWVCYMLDGVEQTPRQTIATSAAIKSALFD